MSRWNRYDEDVIAARQTIRAYGLATLDARNWGTTVSTYKAQALHELARRLELETALAAVRAELAQVIDRMEAAEGALESAHQEGRGN